MSKVNKVQGNARCEVCGNNQGQRLEVCLGGERHIFDSFECAMDALTPKCTNCGSAFVGHGVQSGSMIYCSNQCANDDSVREYEARIIRREQANF